MTNVIHVAVAVIVNTSKEVLLALRQSYQHQGKLWEFPGGKVEANEQVYDALVREIDEEIGLTISAAHALVEICHDYGDKAVLLDVWLVDEFSGEAQGREGQQLRWCAVSNLIEDDFPAANVAIIDAIKSELR
ncbi:MAG: 8-oxo-dGTP diphosphatase MutT [Methylophagaceae bacterium]